MSMAYDNTRGGLYNDSTGAQLNLGKVLEEETGLKAGLFRQPIALTKASTAAFESIFGRVRVLLIRGVKFGTQSAQETFVKQFTDHVDVNGFQDTLEYYPLIHPDNTLAGSNQQDAHYDVLINDFTYRVTEENAGIILEYEMELFQGTTIVS